MDDYLTVNQVAAVVNVHKSTIYRLIYDGTLPWHNISRGKTKARIRVRRSVVDAYMGACERGTA